MSEPGGRTVERGAICLAHILFFYLRLFFMHSIGSRLGFSLPVCFSACLSLPCAYCPDFAPSSTGLHDNGRILSPVCLFCLCQFYHYISGINYVFWGDRTYAVRADIGDGWSQLSAAVPFWLVEMAFCLRQHKKSCNIVDARRMI